MSRWDDFRTFNHNVNEPWHEEFWKDEYPWDDDKIERSRLFSWILVPLVRVVIEVLGRI